MSEKHDTGFAFGNFFDRFFAKRRDAVLDPTQSFEEPLINAIRLTPTHGNEKNDNVRLEERTRNLMQFVIGMIERSPATMVAGRIQFSFLESSFRQAAAITLFCADIAFAGINIELRDVDNGDILFAKQPSHSMSELRALRDVVGMFFVPCAGRQEKDVLFSLEIINKSITLIEQFAHDKSNQKQFSDQYQPGSAYFRSLMSKTNPTPIYDFRNDVSRNQLKAWRESERLHGNKIVFTNGVFDILHRGHVSYLSKASELGELLVIGLNTDASVRRLKGEHRPIQPEDDRAAILSSLKCVDAIVFFDEDTPLELITFLLPDMLVKGADYAVGQIAGSDVVLAHGGNVLTIDLLEGKSTSSAIETILKRYGG